MNAWLTTVPFPAPPGCSLSFWRWFSTPNYGVDGIRVIVPAQSPDLDRYAAFYAGRRGLKESIARRVVLKALSFGGVMVAAGDAGVFNAHPSAAKCAVTAMRVFNEAIRREPRAPYTWDGVAEVRPFGAMEKQIVEGVY